MGTELALEMEAVSRHFGSTVAVDALSLRLPVGAFLGLLGRNGAGKTTTIQMATGLLRPTAGRIRVLGLDVAAQPVAVKRRIGVMPQDDSLLDFLTGDQYLDFLGQIHGLSRSETAHRRGELFETLDLAPPAGTLVREYSYGMKKKLGLAAALLHAPHLLFLDEPFEGIDPVTARTLRELLAGLPARGITLVMTSHVLEIVEKLCDPIAILDRGRLVAEGSQRDLASCRGGEGGLESLFLELVGGARKGELSWL